MKIIEHLPEQGFTLKIVFSVSHNYRKSSWGKHWPKTTQCIVYKNDQIVSIGEVVKHELDKDNPYFARVLAAKKALKNAKLWKELRTKLWDKILKL